MKPTEYWVCALKAREPECWDGPHSTAAAAHKVRNERFPGDKFVVCKVTCEVVPVPRARAPVASKARAPVAPKTKAKVTPRRKLTR